MRLHHRYNDYFVGAIPVTKGVWTKIPDPVQVTCRKVPLVNQILCTLV